MAPPTLWPMSLQFYHVLHVASVLGLFLGLGGVLASADGGKPAKLFTMVHGLALLLMLVAGVGFMHKGGLAWSGGWVWSKIACWVVIGAVPTLIRRGVLPRFLALLVVLALGATAAWLAYTKPF